MTPLKAPFPWAGGKSSIAATIWHLLGNVANYVEPLCGSAAVLLARPHAPGIETINDLDGMVTNAYRAIQAAPDEVAAWADWPVSECDLHARHAWLLTQRDSLTARLEGNPDWYDAKVAGWWIWGACCWIGEGWCSGKGPWHVEEGRLVRSEGDQGVFRQLPHLGDAGRGIHRGTTTTSTAAPVGYLRALAARVRRVRIACGPWDRVLGPSVTWAHGLTGILLDPPYRADGHSFGYAVGGDIWEDCWQWAVTAGRHPLLRIVLCGYDDGRTLPGGWTAVRWKAHGGYGLQGQGRGRANACREILYCSPACLPSGETLPLFAAREEGSA